MNNRLKIRVYSPYFPYPARDGALQVISNQLAYLSQIAEVEVISWKGDVRSFNDDIELMQESEAWSRNLKFRSIADQTKTVSAPIARRFMSLISCWTSPELVYYPPLKNGLNLEPVDLEIFHYSFVSPWIRNLPKTNSKKRVCVIHNIESDLFAGRLQDTRNVFAKGFHLYTKARLSKHEAALPNHFDELWFLSRNDLERFGELYGGCKGRIVSPTYDLLTNIRPSIARTSASNTTFGFIGALDFAPNRESVEFIITKIAPLVKNRKIEIVIAGKNGSPELIDSAKQFEFIKFLGFVPNADAFWKNIDALLIPQVSGSGVRTKLLEALARRIPVLTNTAAAERIDVRLLSSELLHVSDSPQEWSLLLDSNLLRQKRLEALNSPFPQPLLGSDIYRFLLTEI